MDKPVAKVVEIEFTVGLTVTDAAKTNGGIGVVAGVFASVRMASRMHQLARRHTSNLQFR